MSDAEHVVIFDGECMLCSRCVDILLRLDTQKRFKYATLQGKFTKSLGTSLDKKLNTDSIIFYEKGAVYYKSTAILKMLRRLGGMWILTHIFYLIPTFIRDYIYDTIAKYRYKIFGKTEACHVPSKNEKALFID